MVSHEFEQEFKMLGLKIAYYRKLKGYSQETLSEKLGYSNVSYIGNIEAPGVHKTITLTTLFKIAQALDIPPHKLIDFD